MHVEDIPTMEGTKLEGCSPYFAAPEVKHIYIYIVLHVSWLQSPENWELPD